ncbi:hypothetical protein EV182_008375, partial [Spiromyces aspiralis]
MHSAGVVRDIVHSVNISTPPTHTDTRYILNPCRPIQEDSSVPAVDRCGDDSWVCRKLTNYKEGSEPRVIEVGTVAGGSKNMEPQFVATTQSGSSERP